MRRRTFFYFKKFRWKEAVRRNAQIHLHKKDKQFSKKGREDIRTHNNVISLLRSWEWGIAVGIGFV